mgnify:CR=1 FL=1
MSTRESDSLDALLAEGHGREGVRTLVSAALWGEIGEALHAGRLTLVSLWGEPGAAHMAVRPARGGPHALVTLACPEGRFPSVGRVHAPAIRLERTMADLFGLLADDAVDARPWLDHGRWGLTAPLGAATPAPATGAPYAFLPVEGEGLHRIPVGPVHAGIIEPGHFRFTAFGETVVRLEARLGYVHKGLDGLMAGADPRHAARLAGRLSGDSTVAASLAFCRAAEAAAGAMVPERAVWLRGVMAELERLANHFGDVGAICNDAAFPLMLAHCAVLREKVLRAADAAFGHRLMMDRIIPGGLARDLAPEGTAAIRALVETARRDFPPLVALYDATASLQDRTVGTGIVSAELARRFGAGGHVGRASGRDFDARRDAAYPPYDRLAVAVPVRQEGDVNARVWIRIREIEASLDLVSAMLDALPEGPVHAPLPAVAGEGTALVEAFRGDLFAFVRLGADGRVARAHLRDASWFQWPLLEAAIEGNIVADFPLCNKSFNCSYSGADL